MSNRRRRCAVAPSVHLIHCSALRERSESQIGKDQNICFLFVLPFHKMTGSQKKISLKCQQIWEGRGGEAGVKVFLGAPLTLDNPDSVRGLYLITAVS
jgi:hypothetical protein